MVLVRTKENKTMMRKDIKDHIWEDNDYHGCISCGRSAIDGDPWDGECTMCEDEVNEE